MYIKTKGILGIIILMTLMSGCGTGTVGGSAGNQDVTSFTLTDEIPVLQTIEIPVSKAQESEDAVVCPELSAQTSYREEDADTLEEGRQRLARHYEMIQADSCGGFLHGFRPGR